MKKLFIAAAVIFSCTAFQAANAQIHISLGFNIGSQPDWGPVGYDHAEYYYLPDIDAYYSVPTHEFVYLDNNRWIHANSLPPRYGNYDLYNGYKVVVNQANPWQRNSYYRSHYAGYRGRHGQAVIRDSHDARYRNHWHGNNGNYGHANNGNYGHGNSNHGNYNHGNAGNYGRGNSNTGHGFADRANYNRSTQGQSHQNHGNGNDHNHGHHE